MSKTFPLHADTVGGYSRRIEKVLRRWLALPYYLYCLRLAALYYFSTSPTIFA